MHSCYFRFIPKLLFLLFKEKKVIFYLIRTESERSQPSLLFIISWTRIFLQSGNDLVLGRDFFDITNFPIRDIIFVVKSRPEGSHFSEKEFDKSKLGHFVPKFKLEHWKDRKDKKTSLTSTNFDILHANQSFLQHSIQYKLTCFMDRLVVYIRPSWDQWKVFTDVK